MLKKFGLTSKNKTTIHKQVWSGDDSLSKEAFACEEEKTNFLFDAIDSIMYKKIRMVVEGEDINWYDQRVVNKALSQFIDTVQFAYNMNLLFKDAGNISVPILSDQMHFDYLFESVRPAKRFTKWAKLYDDLEQRLFVILVSSYYNVNRDKAKDYIDNMLTYDQIKYLKQLFLPKALHEIDNLLKGFPKTEIAKTKKSIEKGWINNND